MKPRPERALVELCRGRVIANLTDPAGDAIDGILWESRDRLIVLRDANYHARGAAAPTPIDGEAIIPLDRLSFLQHIPAAPH